MLFLGFEFGHLVSSCMLEQSFSVAKNHVLVNDIVSDIIGSEIPKDLPGKFTVFIISFLKFDCIPVISFHFIF